MIFLPNDDTLAAEAKEIVEHVVAKEGRCKIKAWRDVPVDKSVVGRLAKTTEPRIVQVHTCILLSRKASFAFDMRLMQSLSSHGKTRVGRLHSWKLTSPQALSGSLSAARSTPEDS